LSASSRDEVQHIVRQAASTRQPLSVISTGRNWGLGSRMPIADGTSVLELTRMARIRLFDPERGVVVVEPGVTQRQLAAAVADTPWMLNVTSSCADTSLVGNTMDRGDGTFRSRSADVLGLEVVLADGSVITTGGYTADGVYYGQTAGPDLTPTLLQSNLGVVTAMVLSLIARPESIWLCQAVFPRDTVLPLLDLLAHLVGTVPGLGMPRLRDFQLAGRSASSSAGEVSVLIPVLGPETVATAVTHLLTNQLSRVDGRAVIRCVNARAVPPEDPLYPRALLSQGTPTCQLVKQALGIDSCEVDRDAPVGLLIVLPLIPLDRDGQLQAVTTLEDLVQGYPGAVALEINVATRHTARAVVQIGFDRTSPEHTERAHALRDTIWRAFAGRVYRADIDHTPHALHDVHPTTARALGAIKTALDPQNIVMPGRFLTPHGGRP
jgi:4-cresol dehydrogenase (hydroxylating)